ncbi:hypothetical protein TWF694_008382 [Orbilia ellipsospora]|uniref:Uncharacterized protein n=1 Tax=Orbilia ellipsospora TaxID=2528407 RepID=A0AAV9XH58_9PEZI
MLSRPLLRSLPRRTTTPSTLLRRRYSSAHFDSPAAGARSADGTSTTTPAYTTEEKIPTWFLVSTGAIFATYMLYAYIMPTENSPFTRFLSVDNPTRKAQEEISNRHTAFIEQAAKDKHLLLGSEGSPTIEMRFPERINIHSPYNLPAGHTRGVLMDKLEEHYKKENPPK